MRLKVVAAAVGFLAAGALLSAPADAQNNRRVIANPDRTVIVTHDENGRTHTRIIIQKRSFLDPGTAALPSDRNTLDYVQRPDQRAGDVLDNTIFGVNEAPLPGPFTLPFPNNPWLGGP